MISDNDDRVQRSSKSYKESTTTDRTNNQSVYDEYPYYEHDCDLTEMIDDISMRLHILRKKLQLKQFKSLL